MPITPVHGEAVLRQASVVAVWLVLAGCTREHSRSAATTGNTSTQASRSVASSPAPAAESALECGNFIGTEPPPPSFQIVLGVVALPTSPRHPALGTSLTGDGNSRPRLFAKTGLIVKAGTTFELIVPPLAADHLSIGWGGAPATPSGRVLIHNCAKTSASGWLAYAGGYWIDHPACVTLIVDARGQQEQQRIGLGTPCPGQQPPQDSSDR